MLLLLCTLWAAFALVAYAELPMAIEPRAAPVQSFQRCLTQYTQRKVNPVPTRTTTKHLTSRQTVATKTVTVNVLTYTSPWRTVWVTETVHPRTTVIHSTIYVTKTVWTGTPTTRTRYGTRLTTSTTTVTEASVTTSTRTPPIYTVPTLKGFLPILKDPANQPYPEPNEVWKRDAMPEPEPMPEPVAAPSYPKVVSCTKTLKTIVPFTATKTVGWRTVSVRPTATVTVTGTESWWVTETDDITPTNAKTSTIITSILSTVWRTKTSTIWVTVPGYTSTKIVVKPTPTYWAACGTENQAPPPEVRSGWPGWALAATPTGSLVSYLTNDTWVDCCIACHKRPASQGKCIGSFWRSSRCYWNCEEDGCWDECTGGEPPKDLGTCYLLLGGTAGTCRTNKFTFVHGWWADHPGTASNGPGCALWKRAA